MATRTRGYEGGRSATAEREHHRSNLRGKLYQFVGLPLAPFLGLFVAWLIHLWAAGLHIHKGPINWDINTPRGMPTVVAILMALIAVAIARKAGQFAEHRTEHVRNALVYSVALVGVMFAIGVGVGPSYVWTGLFVIVSWSVSALWFIPRLDVARNDKRGDEQHDGPRWLEAIKGWRSRGVTHQTDEHGEPLSTTVEFQHAPGGTKEELDELVPAFESASGSPAGLSYTTPDGRADRSSITVVHKDQLADGVVLPPLPHVGASIMQPLLVGKYGNGEWVWAHLAGDPTGENRWSPTSYLQMGMNRTGKTQSSESVTLTDVESRRDVVILYLNKAKGVQDIRCVIPGIEAAVIADGDEAAVGLYREAIKQIKRIMNYRQRQLGMFGIHEWNAEQCWDNPSWRTNPDTGKREQMERMPFLVCHFAEADAILMDAPGDATYIVSKGLSLGISTGWSLQRADATKMPTGLRFNLGTAWCFGCGDSDSATMALSDWVVKAGAHPERWGQRKPGYFYFEGLGVDEKLFVVPARGFGKTDDGRKLREVLLERNLQNGPRMAKLDRGSASATGDPTKPNEPSWWDATAKATDELRARLLNMTESDLPQDEPDEDPQTGPANPPATADEDDEESEDQVRRELRDEMRETTEVEGVELYPQDEDGTRGKFGDSAKPLPTFDPRDEMSWDDPLPAPRDRKAALIEFARTLDELFEIPELRDPADPTGGTVIVTAIQIREHYKYRSRPFYSETLNGLVSGSITREECPTDKILTLATDLAPTGKYRIQRPSAGYAG